MKATSIFTALLFICITALPNISGAAEVTNNFNKGTITNSVVLIGNVFTVPGDSFIDHWNFTISPTEQFSAIASDIANLPAFEIGATSFGAKLVGPSQTWLATRVDNSVKFDSILLTAGDYDLQIFGTVTGTIGAAYAGTISAFATPVPEASIYYMLLLGLMMLGFIKHHQINKRIKIG